MDFFKAFKGEPNVILIFYYVVNQMKEFIDQDALGKVDEEWICIIKDWQKSYNKTPENTWRTFCSFTGDIPCDFFDKWCLKAIHEYFQISIMIYVPVVDLADNTAFEQPAQDKDRSLLFSKDKSKPILCLLRWNHLTDQKQYNYLSSKSKLSWKCIQKKWTF